MSTKTLARTGSALLNRLLLSDYTLKQSSSFIAKISPHVSHFQNLGIDRNLNRVAEEESSIGEAETLKKVASYEGFSFPCGLPSLRFFIDEGDDALLNDPMLFHTKRTYQPSTIKRKRTHGYLARKATKGGRKVIKRRIAKGRARIAV